MRLRTLPVCAVVSAVLLPLAYSDGGTPPEAPLSTPDAEVVSDPSTFFWGDYDADGLEDAYVISADGTGSLLRNVGDGTFENVTERSGVDTAVGAHQALWGDYDADGRLDLLLPVYGGETVLLRQAANGSFEDTTLQSGLPVNASPIEAHWLDYDQDKFLDLHFVTVRDDLVFHNAGGGIFEPVELGIAARDPVAGSAGPIGLTEARRLRGLLPVAVSDTHGDPGDDHAATIGTATPAGGQVAGTATNCFPAIEDQSTGSCLMASSIPTLGMLYPISNEFFVGPAGRVGIGTTSPIAQLSVVGFVYTDSGLVFPDFSVQTTAQLEGPPGPPGPTGADGADGAQGPTGPAGADGAQGPAGPTGPQGSDGSDGSAGSDGAPGPPGPPGADGAQGPTGPSGGPAGPTGPAGPDGADGADGPPGLPGADGAQGPTGPSGGPAGPTGPQGPAGPDGADGAAGATGPQGNPGPPGADGADGADGMQGPTGPAGSDGADGAAGAPGPPGAPGATGPQGPPGPTDALTIDDAANPGTGIEASSVPDLGKLYPISTDLFVGSAGRVGIGTTSPLAQLSVVGFVFSDSGYVFPDFSIQTTAAASGAPGPTGPSGSTGPAGADGAQGPTGPAGAAGADGASGPSGPAGCGRRRWVARSRGSDGSLRSDGSERWSSGIDGTARRDRSGRRGWRGWCARSDGFCRSGRCARSNGSGRCRRCVRSVRSRGCGRCRWVTRPRRSDGSLGSDGSERRSAGSDGCARPDGSGRSIRSDRSARSRGRGRSGRSARSYWWCWSAGSVRSSRRGRSARSNGSAGCRRFRRYGRRNWTGGSDGSAGSRGSGRSRRCSRS